MSTPELAAKKPMPKRIFAFLVGVIVILLGCAIAFMGGKAIDDLSSDISTMKQEIAALKAQSQDNNAAAWVVPVDEIKRQVAALKQSIDTVKTDASRKAQAEPLLATQVTSQQQAIDELDTATRDVMARLTALEQGLKTRAAEQSLAVVQRKDSPKKRRVASAGNAPFVVTGIERRGDRTFVAVSPKGAQNLDAVRLVAAGEAVGGWQFESASGNQAVFRVGGTTHRIAVQ